MLSLFLCDISDHVFRFLKSIHKLSEVYFLSLCVFCPETFRFTCCIVGNDLVCRIQDVLCGTIVLLKSDYPCIRENTFKSENISNVCSTEFINRLIIITYYAQVSISGSQKAYKLKLYGIGILILIYHDIAKSFLIGFQHILTLLKKVYGFDQKVIEIQGIVSLKCRLIFTVDRSYLFLVKISLCLTLHIIRCDHFILCMRDPCQKSPFLVFFGIDIQLAADFLHQGLLIIRIIDGKTVIISKPVDITPENADTGRVKG